MAVAAVMVVAAAVVVMAIAEVVVVMAMVVAMGGLLWNLQALAGHLGRCGHL
jgi:hypothetical protein